MLRAYALGGGIVEGLTIALSQDALSRSMLNIPALLGAEQLLLFLGRMRALQLMADGLSGLPLPVILSGYCFYSEHRKEN